MTTKDKISALRKEMTKNSIDAFIVFSSDPHASEYLPEEWKERTWLSGFSGSAGFVVILKDKAGLWTDGRYFTQADIELKDSGIDLFKDGIEGTPNYIAWIISETNENARIGVNALVTSHANWEDLKMKLGQAKRNLVNIPLIDEIWKNRGEVGKKTVFVHPVERAGKEVKDKILEVRSSMSDLGATAHIINTLDDIAWMLNLRGSDVECNPVFLSYLYLDKEKTILFVDKEKLNSEAISEMEKAGVETQEYDAFFSFLESLKNQSVLISPNGNQAVFLTLETENKFVVAANPSSLMKATKNAVELEGFRHCMVKDGVAMVKFLHWLTQNVGKESMTEFSIGDKLEGFRRELDNFVGVSFDSIVGYKGNGAIIHYRAPEEGSAEVTNSESVLVDSGGQFLEGTTDITRTLPLGEISEDFKRDYTLVLKGHIQLSLAKFPKGTRGVQLDTLARMAMWKEGKDYNHGTGHGVGSFLNVHEGPQNIRKDLNPQILLEGMVVSNEPGFYPVGKYGIRIENLCAVQEWKKTEWNTFYEFETLTICPISTVPIVKEMLSFEERNWLNNYHDFCKEKLIPFLEGDVKEWFLEQVKAI